MSEIKPSWLVGEETTVLHHRGNQVHLNNLGSALASLTLLESQVLAVDSNWKKPLDWQPLRLSRQFKSCVLLGQGLWTLDPEQAFEPVEKLDPKKPKMLLDQRISAGWALICNHFQQKGFSVPSDVSMLDPVLSAFLLVSEKTEHMVAHLQRVWEASSVLFVPLYTEAPSHSSLLILEKELEGSTVRATFADSLHGGADSTARKTAIFMKNPLLPTSTELELFDVQQQLSDDCGFWILVVMIELLSALRGEGLKSRGSQYTQVSELKSKLSTFVAQLFAEQAKLSSGREQELSERYKKLSKNAARAKSLAKQASKKKGELEGLEALAHKYLNEGAEPELKDLGKEAHSAIAKILDMGNPGVCSRCRWQSGCLSCEVCKAERFYMRQLCFDLGVNVPAQWAN